MSPSRISVVTLSLLALGSANGTAQTESGEIRGRVYGGELSAPLAGAVVYVLETDWTAVTDSIGRFGFLDVPTGFYIVSVYHPEMAKLGLTEPPEGVVGVEEGRVSPIDFQVGSGLEAGSADNPYMLEPLTVVTTRRSTERRRREGARLDVVSREEIELLEMTARNVGDLIREIPGLRVRDIGGSVCVQTRRSIARGGGICPGMVPVFVDDARVWDAGSYLATLSPQLIERVEYLSAIIAGARYGSIGGRGVLLVYTR